MRIGKIRDETEDQVQVTWASHGTNSFLSTIKKVQPSAGLQMKMEITDGNCYKQVSHGKGFDINEYYFSVSYIL